MGGGGGLELLAGGDLGVGFWNRVLHYSIAQYSIVQYSIYI